MTDQPRTWTTQGYAAVVELELIDDAVCDILQDRRADLTPGVERALTRAIDRLRAWREQNGYTTP